MRVEKSREVQPQGKAVTRILKWTLALVIVLIVLAFLLVPAFVSSEKGQKIILAKINSAVDGKTNFANLSMGWLKGIKVADFSFNDVVGRNSIQVKQIVTKPHYFSILMGNLSFGETIIDEPKIEINLRTQRAEEVVRVEKPQPVPVKSKHISLVMDVIVNDGNFKVTDQQAQTVEISQINSKVNLRPPGQQTNFDIDMAVVDKGKKSKISAVGRINPGRTKTSWTLKGTTGDLTAEVNNLDLESLGPIFALAGMDVQAKGLVYADVNSEIKDGHFENLIAGIKAKNLDITGAELKGDRLKSSSLNIDIKLTGEQEFINVEKFQVDSDWLNAKASGVVPTTFKSLADFLTSDSDYSLKGDFEFDLDRIFSQMPRTFGIREGMKVTSGRLSGNIEAYKGKISGQANLIELAGTVDGRELSLSEPVIAELEVTADDERINFDKLDVSSAFAKVNATGSLEQVKYAGQVDLAKLQSQLLQFADIGPYQMAGELSSNGEVSVGEGKITTVGSSQIKNLRFSSAEAEGVSASEPMADITFAFDIDRQKSVVTVDSVEANASLGRISVKDAVLPLSTEAAESMKLIVSANEIDLGKLQPFAVVFASFPQEMQLSGTTESEISVSSEKDSYRIVTDATKIRDFKLISPGKEPFQQEQVLLIFDAEVNPKQKAINVKKLELESPQIKIKKGEFKKSDEAGKTKLQGQANLEYDWSAVSDVISTFLPQGLKIEGQRQDNIVFFCEYPSGQTDKLLANLNTKARLGFEKAEYLGLNLGPTEVDVWIRNGLLKIAPFSTTVNNGQLSFAAEADFKQKPALLKTPGPIQIVKDVQINEETTKKLLMYVNPIFADAVNISGVANFNCERLVIPLASATGNDTVVIGTISINELRLQTSDLLGQILSAAGTSLQGQEITIHPTRFALQDGFLRYDDMQMDVGDNPLNFKGVIGLDKSLDMTVTLPYTVKGKTARVGRETIGERISLPLRGTIDRPELDVGKLLEDQLKKQLEEQLRKGLKGILQ